MARRNLLIPQRKSEQMACVEQGAELQLYVDADASWPGPLFSGVRTPVTPGEAVGIDLPVTAQPGRWPPLKHVVQAGAPCAPSEG